MDTNEANLPSFVGLAAADIELTVSHLQRNRFEAARVLVVDGNADVRQAIAVTFGRELGFGVGAGSR